jgi:hypothetical protein
VQLWRGAITTAEASGLYGGNRAAERKASWPLEIESGAYGGRDADGNHPLSLHGTEGVDYEWGFGRNESFFNALDLKGGGWAQTAGPVVRTDESFTITAWVRLDSKAGDYQTFMSQAGDQRVGFNLNYHAAQDRFQFAMPSADAGSSVTWHSVYSSAAPVASSPGADRWYHIAVVVDVPAKKMHMYVSGELVGTAASPMTPWHADGPLFLGAHGRKNGDHVQFVHGAIEGAQIWQSTVHPDRIATMSRTNPRG